MSKGHIVGNLMPQLKCKIRSAKLLLLHIPSATFQLVIIPSTITKLYHVENRLNLTENSIFNVQVTLNSVHAVKSQMRFNKCG